MSEYQKPHLILWAGIDRAREAIQNRNYGFAEQILFEAQQAAEQSYIIHPEERTAENAAITDQ